MTAAKEAIECRQRESGSDDWWVVFSKIRVGWITRGGDEVVFALDHTGWGREVGRRLMGAIIRAMDIVARGVKGIEYPHTFGVALDAEEFDMSLTSKGGEDGEADHRV